jgi:hypothetical protein
LANNGKKVFKKFKNPLPSSPPPCTCQVKEKKNINLHPSRSTVKEIKINK